MKMELDCFPCLFQQTLDAARMATDKEKKVREIIDEYAQMVPKFDTDLTSPEVAGEVQKMLKEKTGLEDPYQEYKQNNIELALSYYSKIKQIVEESEETLATALVISALGNSMDAGVNLEMDVEKGMQEAARQKFIKSDYKQFKAQLSNSNNVLIVADNAGEAVFDRLLIEVLNQYQVDITYAVREKPVLNDVTAEEAKQLKINQKANLVSTGIQAPGMRLKKASKEFKEIFWQSDLRISKGQGNLEGLAESEAKAEIYFLLKAKCDLVAEYLEVDLGDLVFVKKEAK